MPIEDDKEDVMDNLKRKDIYRILNEEMVNRPYKVPRRWKLRKKDRLVELGIIVIVASGMCMLALAGPREADRVFGVIGLFVISLVGSLV